MRISIPQKLDDIDQKVPRCCDGDVPFVFGVIAANVEIPRTIADVLGALRAMHGGQGDRPSDLERFLQEVDQLSGTLGRPQLLSKRFEKLGDVVIHPPTLHQLAAG